jgi:hypothetical protein
VLVAQKVAVGVYKGVTTRELDELAAETAASMTSKHPDYAQVRMHPPNPSRRAARPLPRSAHRNAFFSEEPRRVPSRFQTSPAPTNGPLTFHPSPPFAARRSHRGLQPAQGDQEVLLGDVRAQPRVTRPSPDAPERRFPSSPNVPTGRILNPRPDDLTRPRPSRAKICSMKIMYEHVNKRNGKWSPLLSDDVYEIIKEVRDQPPPPDSLPPDLGAPSATRLRRFEPQARSRFPRAR